MVKFLVIRFSSIGDIILTTPVVRCLKNQVAGAKIHYLTKSRYASIVKTNPYIDKVHELNDNFGELIKNLKQENFDYVIDLHRNVRTSRVKASLHRMSFSFHKLNVKKWLLVNFKKNLLPDKHIVDRYMNTLKMFSVTNDEKGLDFFIPPIEEVNVDELLGEKSEKLIILVVGGGHFTKQIPKEKIIELIHQLNYKIVFIGGKEDSKKAESIISETGKEKVFNLTGKLNLGQSASLIRQSDIVITPDTGMMHIAAAFKKNILSVWGNTIPKFGMYPYFPGQGSKIFEVEGLSCRPCSKIGFSACPKRHFHCMQKQDTKNMVNYINNALKGLQE